MAKLNEERQKRMAEALRKNLKRRKAQRAGTESDELDGDQRLFREKPIRPEQKRP